MTVVTPSLNHGRFIRETIESVLTQTYPALEYLVIDGGSTDETIAVAREYSDRLTWVSERDAGQAAAINKGWRRARGTIVAYLNSDDTYLPHAVERAVAAFREHPEADVVYGEGYHVDVTGRVLDRYPTEPFRSERLAETCFICQPAAFLRRRVAERVGYLDELLQYCMDYDLWIRLAHVARFAHIPEYLATSRLHPDTKTLAQRARAHVEILRTVHRHFRYVPPPLDLLLRSRRPRSAPPGHAVGTRAVRGEAHRCLRPHARALQPGRAARRAGSLAPLVAPRLAKARRAPRVRGLPAPPVA